MPDAQTVLRKHEGNPIITPKDMPFPCETVYNAGATTYQGKQVILLRCGRHDGRSVFGLAMSEDGYHFKIHPEPVFSRATEGLFKEPENKGVEDPRVTQIGDTYYIFYSCYSSRGFQIGLAKTRDFLSIERVALTVAAAPRPAAGSWPAGTDIKRHIDLAMGTRSSYTEPGYVLSSGQQRRRGDETDEA